MRWRGGRRLSSSLRRNGRRERAILLGMAPFFGFHKPNYTFPGVPDDKLFDHDVDQAKAAEAAGFDLVTVIDQFYQIRGVSAETNALFEAYTTLPAYPAHK